MAQNVRKTPRVRSSLATGMVIEMWKRLITRGRIPTSVLILVFALALISVRQVKAQEATVYVSPAANTVSSVGSTFSVNISIQNVTNLCGWEFKLYYPNHILNGTSATQGPFLKAGGVQTFFMVTNFTDDYYHTTQGLVTLLCLRVDPDAPGVDGNGVLATITFNSTSNNGPEGLHLDEVKLSDPNATQIPCTVVDGEVTVVPEFPMILILPLLMITSAVSIAFRKKTCN